VELDEARDFLRTHHRGVLATRRRGGDLQLSPVTVAVDGEGRLVVSSRETAYKVANLRRDPRVTLCVLDDGFFGTWIQVEGTATVVSLPEALEPLVDYYRAVAGEHPDWDDYRRAMEAERRVLVRVALDRAGPDRAG